jgi:hypothetical protein
MATRLLGLKSRRVAFVIPRPWISEIIAWPWTELWSRLFSERDAMVLGPG